MDKISKILSKLRPKERAWADRAVRLIRIGQVSEFDVKKLKGFDNIFRVRKGRVGIIYKIDKSYFVIIDVQTRNDNTYNL